LASHKNCHRPKLLSMKYFSAPLFALALFTLAAWRNPLTDNWQDKIDPDLLALAERGEQVEFLILLHEQADLSAARNIHGKTEKGSFVFERLHQTAKQSQVPVVQVLQADGATFKPFFIVNAIFAKGDLTLLKKIAELPAVREIQGNYPMRTEDPVAENTGGNRGPDAIEWGISMINADDVWAMGYTGQGIVVGGEDTGYQWFHPALKNKYRGYNAATDTVDHDYNWHDAIHEINPLNADSLNPCGLNVTEPCDDNSHGTHTMGTMVGSDGDNMIGVAPDAKWCGCRNMERGWGSPATYIECFEWFIAPTDLANANPDPSKAPHVINNSWSCPPIEGCNSSNFALMEMVVSNVKASGIVVVVSAGNSGGQGCGSINTPAAIFENSFTIGATAQNDTIAGFSSRGPVLVDASNRLKPNVSAPGVGVRSSVPGGNYAHFSGTSMAGPHVAGLVALLLSANPDLAGEVETIETIIEQTAVPKTDTTDCGSVPGEVVPNNIYGFGRVDALAAVQAALALNNEDVQSPENEMVKVFPNPFEEAVSFELNVPCGESRLEIFDSKGRLLKREIFNVNQGERQTASLAGATAGVYFYKITCEKGSWEGRLMKF
ncbi:MAG: S8 family serine peptidase, partial [Bacteroidota bacterium]